MSLNLNCNFNKLWRIIFALCFVGLPLGSAHAQNNYYDLSDPRVANLLGNVEKFHLPPGIAKMKAGRYISAMADFEFILGHFPNHPKALLLVGDLSLKMNQTKKAETYFEKAVELYPNAARTYMAYGIFLHKRGQLDEAVEKYNKSIELNPNSSEAHYNLGLTYVALKKYELANEQAQRAYAMGYPLPGLRNKLRQVNAWKPSESGPQVEKAVTKPAAPPADEAAAPPE